MIRGMSAPPIRRKLAAILAADAVGYSRLMAANEEGTLRVLSAHRAVIDGIIAFHSGRIVGTAGDSVLAEFASPVEALRCAVEVQAALKTRNESLPEASRLQFRIGINLGDVMVKGDDLLGDGVNVAARLEGIAEPGGICISSSVYDQIAGKLDLGIDALGEKSLKNIERPVRVYRVRAGASSPRRPARGRRAAPYALAGLAAAALGAGWWAVRGPGAALPPPPPAPAVRAAPDGAAKGGESAPGRAAAASRAAAQEKAARELALAREDARRKAEEAREAQVRAHAQEEIAKARADARLAKARAEAEAMRREAAAELAAAKARTAPAPAGAPGGPGQERGASVALAAPAVPATPKAAPWMATLHCDAFRGAPEFVHPVPVRLEGETFAIERRPAGMPGHLVLRGTPGADGSLALSGTLVAPRGPRRGEELPVRLAGSREGERYVARGRLGRRPCEVQLARRVP